MVCFTITYACKIDNKYTMSCPPSGERLVKHVPAHVFPASLFPSTHGQFPQPHNFHHHVGLTPTGPYKPAKLWFSLQTWDKRDWGRQRSLWSRWPWWALRGQMGVSEAEVGEWPPVARQEAVGRPRRCGSGGKCHLPDPSLPLLKGFDLPEWAQLTLRWHSWIWPCQSLHYIKPVPYRLASAYHPLSPFLEGSSGPLGWPLRLSIQSLHTWCTPRIVGPGATVKSD